MLKISQWRYLVLATLLSLSCTEIVSAEPTAKLTVIVNGISHQKGQICLRVYNSAKGFPMSGTGVKSGCTKITGPLSLKFLVG